MDVKPNTQQPAKRIKMQSVKKAVGKKFSAEELLAQVCYHYPQITLEQAETLSYRKVQLLLRVARKEQAIQMYNLTQIAAAPHTKKGEGVNKLSEHFKKIANS